MTLLTVAERLSSISRERDSTDAVIFVDGRGGDERISWGQLDRRANHCATELLALGVAFGGTVAVALPNSIEHVVATLAVWKLNGTVVPVDPRWSTRERDAFILTARPDAYIHRSEHPVGVKTLSLPDWSKEALDCPAPPATVRPMSAYTTGGSTGRPKVILRSEPWMIDDEHPVPVRESQLGIRCDQVQLVAASLFHTGFGALYRGLTLGHTIVLFPRVMPRQIAAALEAYKVNYLRLVPTIMRLLMAPEVGLAARDVSSIEAIQHGTAPCPADVKRAWIRLIGAENVYEVYSSQERIGFVSIRGDEWLAHPGSVGKPDPGCVVLVDHDGRRITETGKSGLIYFRCPSGRPTYMGEEEVLPQWGKDYYSIGDFGHFDNDEYLYVLGRRGETINVGGSNVFPAEVEDVLVAHRSVIDACVVALPHTTFGEVVHALVVMDVETSAMLVDLAEHCRSVLQPHKVPYSFQIVPAIRLFVPGVGVSDSRV